MRVRAGQGRYGRLKDMDWIMCGLVLAISVAGLVQVYSATVNTRFQHAFASHAWWLLLGGVMFWIASRLDYHISVSVSPLLWIAGVLGLIAVLLFAEPVNGARRWLPVPFGFSLQPSEFLKVVLVLVVTKYWTEHSTKALSPRGLAILATAVLVPFVLVVLQPDLGTALSMLPVLGMALFLSTIRRKLLIAVCVVGVLLSPVGWSMLKPYQKDRITGFMDPDKSPLDAGYQILQSKIAVGSGGIWGQGFVQGSQTQLRFLPTPHTDFILAAFAEERGFVGVAVVLALYYALLMRIVQTGNLATDAAGMLISMTVAVLLLFHVVVNVGMVAHKLPVTGLPLPLMSYGGSNLVAFLAMLGLVHNVRQRRIVN